MGGALSTLSWEQLTCDSVKQHDWPRRPLHIEITVQDGQCFRRVCLVAVLKPQQPMLITKHVGIVSGHRWHGYSAIDMTIWKQDCAGR